MTKRGKGRFYEPCQFNFETINNRLCVSTYKRRATPGHGLRRRFSALCQGCAGGDPPHRPRDEREGPRPRGPARLPRPRPARSLHPLGLRARANSRAGHPQKAGGNAGRPSLMSEPAGVLVSGFLPHSRILELVRGKRRSRGRGVGRVKVKVIVSEQLAEFFNAEAGVLDDASHGIGVNGIVARNRKEAPAIGHYDMFFSLAQDCETGLFQGSYGMQVFDPGKLGHFRRPLLFREYRYP